MVRRVLGKKKEMSTRTTTKTMYIKILVFYLKHDDVQFCPITVIYRKLALPSSNPHRHFSLSPWFPLSENESSQICITRKKT